MRIGSQSDALTAPGVEGARAAHAPARPSVLRRLWRLLPSRTRDRILFDATRLMAPRPDRAPEGGFPLGIAGMFSTASGIGEGARLAYTALDVAGIAPMAFDLSPAFGQVEFATEPSRRVLDSGSGGSLVVYHNGPSLPHSLLALGRSRIGGRRIIGHWAWELPQLPKSWDPSFRYLHEIWVQSAFTRDAVAAATNLPIHIVPPPLPAVPATPDMRSRLGLPRDALIVLTAFHVGSSFTRKNPLAAIAAFRRAFEEASDAILAIKVIDNSAGRSRQELDTAIAGVPNIRVIDAVLSSADMTGLIAAADIVLSLHRAEGFGLVPAEAMRLGKPVVATGWSGNLEFMSARNSALVSYSMVPVRDPHGAYREDGQMWAEANVDHAAEWLRLLASSELRNRIGSQAAKDIGERLSPARFVETVTKLIAPEEAFKAELTSPAADERTAAARAASERRRA